MKYNVLMFILLIIPMWLLSDEISKDLKYAHGKLFLQNNDTINVYIKVESIYKMQSEIQYIDTTGHEFILLPSKAKGFCLMYQNDTMYFESSRDLKMVLFTSKKAKSSFIYRISNGKLPLFYVVEKELKMDGFDQITVDAPRYLILLDQEWYPITPKYFVSDFNKIFSNLKSEYDAKQLKLLQNEIVERNFMFDHTPIIISKLNMIPSIKN
jgi:hypothetical protein